LLCVHGRLLYPKLHSEGYVYITTPRREFYFVTLSQQCAVSFKAMTSTFLRITTATFHAVFGNQMKRPQRTVVIMWLGAILSLTTLTYAQFPNASVTGQVIDSSKAIIAGAHILAVNVNTNIRYEAATNGAGEYYFPNLHRKA
jgi:hypothetical protein